MKTHKILFINISNVLWEGRKFNVNPKHIAEWRYDKDKGTSKRNGRRKEVADLHICKNLNILGVSIIFYF
jgi:hypothetical protein